MDSRAAGHGLGEWMAENGMHLVKKEEQEKPVLEHQPAETAPDAADVENTRNSSGKRGESARTKVRNAQLKVLDRLNDIVDGNLGSATEGNHNCAKFMLDWSGVSDLRSPLARPKQQTSLSKALLDKLKRKTDSKKKPGKKK